MAGRSSLLTRKNLIEIRFPKATPAEQEDQSGRERDGKLVDACSWHSGLDESARPFISARLRGSQQSCRRFT